MKKKSAALNNMNKPKWQVYSRIYVFVIPSTKITPKFKGIEKKLLYLKK